jgi:hypothetical protein
MSTLQDVKLIASSLPGALASPDGVGYSLLVKGKLRGFIWPWLERIHPKKARVPNLDVMVVRVSSLSEKDILLGSDDLKFFTEHHYNGYRAIFVRLAAVDPTELQDLIEESWSCTASRPVVS